jgi:hypothetical protein
MSRLGMKNLVLGIPLLTFGVTGILLSGKGLLPSSLPFLFSQIGFSVMGLHYTIIGVSILLGKPLVHPKEDRSPLAAHPRLTLTAMAVGAILMIIILVEMLG